MRRSLLSLILFSAFAGCSPADHISPPNAETDAGFSFEVDAGFVTGPTWYRDISPIVQRNCEGCHVEGGIAPFRLDDVGTATAMAEQIAHSTKTREMPPFPADNSGACNTFKDARWLTEDEIELIGKWAEAGAPVGDPADAVSITPISNTLENPTSVAVMTEPYTPVASGVAELNDFRCFIVDPKIMESGFLTAFEVVPGDRRVVHHLGLFAVEGQGLADAEKLDADEAGLGYSCVGGPRVTGKLLGAWGPGMGPMRYPDNTGVKVSAGAKLILQMHYSLISGAYPDQTKVRLRVDPTVTKEGFIYGVGNADFTIQPGVANQTWVKDTALWLFPAKAKIYGVAPHMHTLGTKFSAEILRNGAQESCLVNVPVWDFHWHQTYWYEQPITANWGDTIRVHCTWDGTDRTEPVKWGEGTLDEMCSLFFYAVAEQ